MKRRVWWGDIFIFSAHLHCLLITESGHVYNCTMQNKLMHCNGTGYAMLSQATPTRAFLDLTSLVNSSMCHTCLPADLVNIFRIIKCQIDKIVKSLSWA